MSRHRKKLTEQVALTPWRWQREGLVKTWKKIDQARGTHSLEIAEGGTCQDTEKNRLSEGHSLAGDGRGRNLSRHRKKLTEQVALTLWRWQREGLVKTWKKIDQARSTHSLEMAEGVTCQDTEKNRLSEGHSLAGDGKGRNLSGHENKPTKRGSLTFWRQQRKGLVRTWKQTDRARDTHQLKTAVGGIYQDTERN